MLFKALVIFTASLLIASLRLDDKKLNTEKKKDTATLLGNEEIQSFNALEDSQRLAGESS